MSLLEKHFPFLYGRKSLPYLLFILFLMTYSISAMMRGSALSQSQSNPIVIWTSLVVFGYIFIISVMKSFGQEPNKFEMVFIPGFFITIMYVGLTAFGIDVVEDPTRNKATTQTQIDTSTILSQNEIQTVTTTSVEIITVTREPLVSPNILEEYLFQIQIGIIIIFIIMLIALLYLRRETFTPQLEIMKEIEYTTNPSINNKLVMTYYVEASIALENLKGKAEIWISPTGYSKHITIDPGSPVGDYFKLLTNLYEIARFSKRIITEEDVREAIELHQQVISWVKNYGGENND